MTSKASKMIPVLLVAVVFGAGPIGCSLPSTTIGNPEAFDYVFGARKFADYDRIGTEVACDKAPNQGYFTFSDGKTSLVTKATTSATITIPYPTGIPTRYYIPRYWDDSLSYCYTRDTSGGRLCLVSSIRTALLYLNATDVPDLLKFAADLGVDPAKGGPPKSEWFTPFKRRGFSDVSSVTYGRTFEEAVTTLRSDLFRRYAIIIFIWSDLSKRDFHDVVVVGYDENGIYTHASARGRGNGWFVSYSDLSILWATAGGVSSFGWAPNRPSYYAPIVVKASSAYLDSLNAPTILRWQAGLSEAERKLDELTSLGISYPEAKLVFEQADAEFKKADEAFRNYDYIGSLLHVKNSITLAGKALALEQQYRKTQTTPTKTLTATEKTITASETQRDLLPYTATFVLFLIVGTAATAIYFARKRKPRTQLTE